MSKLSVGSQAPDFTLPDKDGKMHSLSDYRGKKVIVYFYPKDNTPGCTKQACAFRDAYAGFRRNDIEVIGISKDSIASHEKFIDQYSLPFLLLSDTQQSAIQAYDVLQEKKLFGKTYLGVVRSTFIINEDGEILKIFPKANPASNAQDILNYLSENQ